MVLETKLIKSNLTSSRNCYLAIYFLTRYWELKRQADWLTEGKFLFRSGNFKSELWFSWSLGRLEIDCSRVMPIHKLFSKIHRFKQVYFTKYRNTQTNLLIMKIVEKFTSFLFPVCATSHYLLCWWHHIWTQRRVRSLLETFSLYKRKSKYNWYVKWYIRLFLETFSLWEEI